MAERKLQVMISSTSLDLPEHREKVMRACLRSGMSYPDMMEHLTADTAPPLDVSLKMVDEADLYLGIFGVRYGTIPPGQTISITEAEYNRAAERNIPRLIFLMGDDHDIKASYLKPGDNTEKLAALKVRLQTENTVAFFDSADDLVAQVFQALIKFKDSDTEQFHYVSSIPIPPEKYIAHPYTLLQTHSLVGRQYELNLLTNWVANPKSDIYQAHTLSVVAIGGMGKSALTWKWFEDIAPQEMKELAGKMWWSFYESDASFENFIIRALAYVSKRPIEEVQKISSQDREAQLLSILDKEPFLLVLDGLERILIAYARMDAAYLSDSNYDQATANYVAKAYGLPESAAKSFTGEHRLRKTADPRAGSFLKRLSRVRAARVLISTRLYPFDLQMLNGSPLPGCNALFMPGLSNDDALNLWRSFGVSGAHDQLIPIFNSFDNHALLIQALASEVANYRSAPGNFEKWREANPGFDPAKYPYLQDAMGHVLAYALRGLSEMEQKVLQTIAGFRMPTHYDALASVMIGEGKPCKDVRQLHVALAELEDRGLVGWDKRANRYDLHPIVRGVVWSGLGDDAKRGVYTNLHAHFESVPMIGNWQDVNSLDDLTPAIELYNTLIGMGRFDDAFIVFRDRMSNAILYRLCAGRHGAEMLEKLFLDGLNGLSRLAKQRDQAYSLNLLASAYQQCGQPGRAVLTQRQANVMDSDAGDDKNLSIGLCNLSNKLQMTGGWRESEGAARRSLAITRRLEDRFGEAYTLYTLGLILSTCGEVEKSKQSLGRSLSIVKQLRYAIGLGTNYANLGQGALWSGMYAEARAFADRAWELAYPNERDFVRAARVQGEAALGLEDFVTTDERLHHALSRARGVNLVEEELPALTALAELRRRLRDEKAAKEFLDDVWEFAERGPYPLFHADALNVLAQIERDAGNTDKAIEAATKAYQLAWCDGPPYAYHWGLIKAQKHLEELKAPLPDMPAFDESKFEPMPDVEIDPDDEFHVGAGEEEE